MDQAVEWLRQARRVVVFTGAGVSAESGIPTFRDAQTGLWARFDAQQLATPEAFAADPELVWGWYEWRRAAVDRVAPNAAHEAVAAIEAHVPDTVVVTQNVDDLHERAGSRAPVHLHGSLFAPRCANCHAAAAVPGEPAAEGRVAPPRCDNCHSLVRPGVVWFGEALPAEALQRAAQAAYECDLLLTIGTSGLVHPAAEIPLVAKRGGGRVIQINPAATPLDAESDVNLRGKAAEILPELVARAFGKP
ncbi:SIR2 family NAD-dependent protein deacylase [Actinoplanes sp. RD1]|uniref:SIR2 family NAD-dependent protein deacylase n=1 Tax=Actinoplanes sp. RD1 TaxID=3064538 RepID=UPI00274246EB|nr:NAD-dependent deacylase [Actinoplanes sp. RD1]